MRLREVPSPLTADDLWMKLASRDTARRSIERSERRFDWFWAKFPIAQSPNQNSVTVSLKLRNYGSVLMRFGSVPKWEPIICRLIWVRRIFSLKSSCDDIDDAAKANLENLPKDVRLMSQSRTSADERRLHSDWIYIKVGGKAFEHFYCQQSESLRMLPNKRERFPVLTARWESLAPKRAAKCTKESFCAIRMLIVVWSFNYEIKLCSHTFFASSRCQNSARIFSIEASTASFNFPPFKSQTFRADLHFHASILFHCLCLNAHSDRFLNERER